MSRSSCVSASSYIAHAPHGSSPSCVRHVIPSTCAHDVCGSPSTLISPFSSPFTSRTSCRTPSTFTHLKLVDNLRIPPKESMDSFHETYSNTGYEPNAYDFKETSVEPYTELLTSPPFLSDKGFPRTQSTMTPHSRVFFVKLTEYIAITLNEKTCLSVCRLRQCLTERCDLLETERGDLLS